MGVPSRGGPIPWGSPSRGGLSPVRVPLSWVFLSRGGPSLVGVPLPWESFSYGGPPPVGVPLPWSPSPVGGPSPVGVPLPVGVLPDCPWPPDPPAGYQRPDDSASPLPGTCHPPAPWKCSQLCSPSLTRSGGRQMSPAWPGSTPPHTVARARDRGTFPLLGQQFPKQGQKP